MARTNYFQWDDDDEVHFALDQHAELGFYIASSLSVLAVDRWVESRSGQTKDYEIGM
jgi:hypothetical protein